MVTRRGIGVGWSLAVAACLAVGLLHLAVGPGLAVSPPGYVGFDDLKTTAKGGGGQVPVTDQYAEDPGVLFNSPLAFDYSNQPGFTRSGTVAIEQCYAAEFCTSPIGMTFRVPVYSVSLWVGHDGPLSVPTDLQLTVSDASGAPLATSTVTIPASDASQPISLNLAATDSGGRIASATVAATNGAYMNDYAVDDVAFEVQPPEPSSNLRLGTITSEATESTVTLTLDVENDGPDTSPQTTVTAEAPGWDTASGQVGPVEPRHGTSASIVLPIPDAARGGQASFTVTLDPDALAGDPDQGDNVRQVSVDIPAPPAAGPSPTGPAPEPTVAPPEPTPTPSDGGGGLGIEPLTLVGGLVVLGIAGGAAYLRLRSPKGPDITLNLDRKLQLELDAQTGDPPDSCRPGSDPARPDTWYCKKAFSAIPRPRHIAELRLAAHGRKNVQMAWPDETVARLSAAARAAHRTGPGSLEWDRLEAFGPVLAANVATWVRRAAPVDVDIQARVVGSEGSVTFSAYVCRGPKDDGRFGHVADWKKPFKDDNLRGIAHFRGYVPRDRPTSDLGAELSAGLGELARHLGILPLD